MGLFQLIRPGGGGGGGKTLNLDALFGASVLVVGSGGREHAIISALSKSVKVSKIYAAPGNPYMGKSVECLDIKEDNIDALLNFAKEMNIGLTIVGPEIPLSLGIVDAFTEAGLSIFGPTKAAAQVESSKDFAKGIMKKYSIPTADYQTFATYEQALDYVSKKTFPIVLKYDGLAAGKGVVIAKSLEEAKQCLKSFLLDHSLGDAKVVIEDFLEGCEFSFMALVNGDEVFPLALAQDHKAVNEGDTGPNTGGMGAYSPMPLISKEDESYALEHILKPMAEALKKENCPFKGVLYAGLIKTTDGIKVIEFNCRFGDPETEVVLPRLKTDLFDMLKAVADGENYVESLRVSDMLAGAHFRTSELMPKIEWEHQVCLGIVLASKGYPGAYEKGHEIDGLDELLEDPSILVYSMGLAKHNDKPVNKGGRVLMIAAKARTYEQARTTVLNAISKIKCEALFYRKDIGWRVIS